MIPMNTRSIKFLLIKVYQEMKSNRCKDTWHKSKKNVKIALKRQPEGMLGRKDKVVKCENKEGITFVTPRYFWRPQGDSNPRYRRERAMSWTGLDDRDIKLKIYNIRLRPLLKALNLQSKS
jgi:hypothetical protein